MTEQYDTLEHVLRAVHANTLSVDEAKAQLNHYDELGFAKIDLHRTQRQGFPEVIFGEGKTKEQLDEIVHALIKHDEIVLITRINQEKADSITAKYCHLEYHETAHIVSTPIKHIPKTKHYASIICAGTSDLPVAEEAAVTAEVMGIQVQRFYDVGFQAYTDYLHILKQFDKVTFQSWLQAWKAHFQVLLLD